MASAGTTTKSHGPIGCAIKYLLLIVFTSLSLPAHAQSESAAPPAPAVTVALIKERSFQESETFSGRIEAIESVNLIARVQGYLEARHFEEGSFVEKGDLLYELDQDIYRNTLTQAQAALQVAQANETLAQQKFNRQEELTKRDVQSRALLEESQANLAVSQANVAAAQSKVEAAEINLAYTKITAPITGLIGRSVVSTGDLISAQSGPMATIVQSDPIYASFPVPQRSMIDFRKRGARNEDVFVSLTLADGSTYEHHGKISFTDVSAAASSDAIIVRATVPNPDNMLINNGLVDVNIVANEDTSKLALPLQALLLDQQGAYVLVVDEDNIVKAARIEVGEQRGGYLVVQSGLDAGAKVIVGGIQKARPGSKVAPSILNEAN